jgi:hypothetical protein
MRRHRVWLCAVLLLLGGCQLPARGTPVFVDTRAGNFWSGEGVLTEVAEDEQRCRVSVRDRALLVRDRWVECRFVHPLRSP